MVLYIILQLIITTLFGSSHAFWWGSSSTESAPVLKQVPVGYFRTYTYQPLAYPPPAPYSPYTPLGSHPSAQYESQNSVWTQYNPPSDYNPPKPKLPHPQPAISVTNAPTSTPQYQPTVELQNYQGSISSNNQPNSNYASPPLIEIQPAIQQAPAPLSNSLPVRQVNSDLSGYQYLSGVSSLPVQQIQFVPCMCPVSVSMASSEISENRAMPDSEDFLQSDIGEQDHSKD